MELVDLVKNHPYLVFAIVTFTVIITWISDRFIASSEETEDIDTFDVIRLFWRIALIIIILVYISALAVAKFG